MSPEACQAHDAADGTGVPPVRDLKLQPYPGSSGLQLSLGGTGFQPVTAEDGTRHSGPAFQTGSRGITVRLIVRLEGTNAQAGRAVAKQAAASLPTLQAATDLSDAAEKVTPVVRAGVFF